MRTLFSLCSAIILGVGGVATASVASAWTVAGSGCVRSGQTEDYCIGRFIETLSTMLPPGKVCDAPCQANAISDGLGVVDSMVRSFDRNAHSLPPDKMFWDCVAHTREANPWMEDWQTIGFVRASIYWFGPPGMEDAVNDILPH